MDARDTRHTSDTKGTRATGPIVERIFGDPGSIAPSVEKAWRDDFILELRLRSVNGQAIGDALMTVETHVAESGASAHEAFGQPKAYAGEIASATAAAGSGWAVSATTIAGSLLGLLGMFLSVAAFTGWLEGEPVEVSTGGLVGFGLVILLASTAFFTATLRLLAEHRWIVLPIPALLVGALVGLFVLLEEPLFELPVPAVAAAGIILLVASVALSWAEQPADLDQVSAPGRKPSVSTFSQVAAAAIFPLMTLVLLLLTWVLHLIVT
ncbi:hypothetical protein [Ornithinimicrobium sufpigmenti]|uniref:hypothetical protein n=1 Tax=Ornithinimicrobium sufpigmenti TaxID=2508882 RepID=UPI00103640F7|nr:MULTISPECIES: hypothetical protein [unclassified Ornithinimicrobium]